MPRIARLEIPGHPYHIIQRGNRSQKVFIKSDDKAKYLEILKLQAQLYDVEIWAYCLMDNHVHLIVMPKAQGALTACISEVHRQYTRMVNFRERWRGYLWQGRFKSFLLDERYLFAAVRYVERNPVRAKLVREAEDFEWSSARTHVKKEHSSILTNFYLVDDLRTDQVTGRTDQVTVRGQVDVGV